MSNVIVFPKAKKNTPPNSIEEILENAETLRREQVEFLVDEVLSLIFYRTFLEGFDLLNDECAKSTALMVESLKAALYNTQGIPHPLHDMASHMFMTEEEMKKEDESILIEPNEPDPVTT